MGTIEFIDKELKICGNEIDKGRSRSDSGQKVYIGVYKYMGKRNMDIVNNTQQGYVYIVVYRIRNMFSYYREITI